MGYTTDFDGALAITPALKPEVAEYINRFSGTRRMKRNVADLTKVYGGEHGFNGNYGIDGEFFAHEDGDCGQSDRTGVQDFNCRPSTQPGLWCQWVIRTTKNGEQYLEWDGNEKFYNYVEWLRYVIDNFIAPQGSVCNGEILWQGEDYDDRGRIRVVDNKVKKGKAKITYEDD